MGGSCGTWAVGQVSRQAEDLLLGCCFTGTPHRNLRSEMPHSLASIGARPCLAELQALQALWAHPPLHPRLALLLSNRAAALLSMGRPLRCDGRVSRSGVGAILVTRVSYLLHFSLSQGLSSGLSSSSLLLSSPTPSHLQRTVRLPDGTEVRPRPAARRPAGGDLPQVRGVGRGVCGKERQALLLCPSTGLAQSPASHQPPPPHTHTL